MVWCLVSPRATGMTSSHQQGDPAVGTLASQLSGLRRVFPVADKRLGLFEIDRDFVLQVSCWTNQITNFYLEPKYAYADTHSNWKPPKTQPTLASKAFLKVMAAINGARPLGREIQPFEISGFVVFGKTDGFARYENAALFARVLTSEPLRVASFDVHYFRKVSGIVDRVVRASPIGWWVRIGPHEYWSEGTSAELQAGTSAEGIPVAGPTASGQRPVCKYEF